MTTTIFCRACPGENSPAAAAAADQPARTRCGALPTEMVARRLRDIGRMLRDGDRADAQRLLTSTIEEYRPCGHAASWMDAAAACLTASDAAGALRCLENVLEGPQPRRPHDRHRQRPARLGV